MSHLKNPLITPLEVQHSLHQSIIVRVPTSVFYYLLLEPWQSSTAKDSIQLSFFPECATLPDWMKTSLTTRIVGGQKATSPIPWQAHLHKDNSPVCGATIIDEETVLTSTFCVVASFSNFALFDKTKFEIEAGVVLHGDSDAQTSGISEIIVHPCNRRAEVTIDRYVRNH